MPASSPVPIAMINEHLGGYNSAMGLRFVATDGNELAAELEVGERHLQPYGLVHGGVLASMVETLCSVGAAMHVREEGKSAVGLENSTSFLRAARSGILRGTARPVRCGRRSHVWAAEIRDDRDRLVASGRVRLMILEAGATAAGLEVRLQEPGSPG